MDYLNFNSYKDSNDKKLNRKKIITIIILICIIIIGVILFSLYISNVNFRNNFDKYILRKNISNENLASITLSSDNYSEIFAYDKYISILSKNTLTIYSGYAKKESENILEINQPIYDSNNRFMVIAEKNGSKLYLISGTNVLWENTIEGQISRVTVNKNGYVSVIISGTSYKTIVTIFNPDGKKLFNTYLSETIAIDTDISNDNKYLAIAEINSSGSIIESSIEIISIEDAQSNPNNSKKCTYRSNENNIVTNIKYQDKNKLICIYDNSIHILENEQDKELINLSSGNILFSDINLTNNIALIEEEHSGLFANVQVSITNTNTNKEVSYLLSGIPKNVYVHNSVIAINIGTEVHFINTNGWLLKKYTSSQEVKEIVLGSSIAGIIYKDKIEFVNL